MANLLQRLNDGIDGASFDASLGGEIGKLVEIAQLAATLNDNPDGLAAFIAALAGLIAPALPDGGDVQAGLGEARGAIPAITGGAAPDALADLSRFSVLVTEDLLPLLGRTLDAARAIEGVAKAEFRCPAEPDSMVPPGSEPPPPSGASRAAVVEARALDMSARVDQLPDPLTPEALIEFLVGIARGPERPFFLPVSVPLLDDILLPVQTLGRWSLDSPAQVGTEIASTLTALRDRLLAATGEIEISAAPALGLQAALRVGDLSTFAADYDAAATAMAEALETDDPAGAATQAATLDGHIAAFETVRGSQAADFTPLVPAAVLALSELPRQVHDRLLHLATQLEPVDPGPFFTALESDTPATPEDQQELQDHLAPLIDFMEDLGEKLDLSAIEGGVGTVATEAQQIADQISGALSTVALETRSAFAEVEAAVQNLPLDDLADEIRAVITEIGNTLEREITDAFAPLRDALAEAIQAISDAIDTLDPQAISDAVTQAVAEITSILQDPAVVSAAEDIRAALDEAAQAASTLSFAPVTDEVVKLIEQMEAGLRALDDTELNDALLGLLNIALRVLPPDLRPVTQPLIDDLGVKIEQGPVELLEEIREKPQEVVDRIRSFDPGTLVTQTLGGPFAEAKGALQAVQPSALLDPLEAALAAEKVRLKQVASPSRVLAPVSEAFDGLLSEFDQLSPDALLAPIEAAIEQAVQDVIEAAPIDEIFDQIDEVFDTIQAVLDTVNSVEEALSKVATALSALEDPDAAIDGWRDATLAKLDGLPNAAALNTLLSEIASAIDGARGQDLLPRYNTAVDPLMTALDGLDPEAALSRMVALRQRLLPLMRALPAGPERTAIEDVLGRFDPLDAAHTGGLRAASVLHEGLRDARDGLESMAADFEDALHGPDGMLTDLRNGAADASLLRGAVEAEVEKALVPVRYLIARLGGAAVPVGVVAGGFADLSSRLTSAVGNILTGPASLQTITDAVQQVVDTVRNIDLAFLRESIEGVFQSVRAEIEAAGPGPLIVTLDREFGEVIDALDLSLILPQPEIDALDQSVADAVAVLQGFDPATLIGASVRDRYEADVLPLVEALDITPVFDALIEALRGLEVELEGEMERINTAYGALLAARPGGAGGGASIGTG
ncbi:hypothetical protein R5H30_12280 [Sulfitobacter sp. D35]|uniref:hypothetical protein n=1 Tax=Sulfitobacter sp. D35 TaxID=3083252 RepID=UPI00296F30B0|nr:hypothetical protein [Sulfitobacter sp. D35]MDW4498764.1 hypothetical protein [Sulfitobacter sp. D35]